MSGIKVEVTKQYFVPNSVIEEVIIDMAGYGMTSWATRAEVDNEAHTYTVWHEREWSPLDDPEVDEEISTVLTYAQIAKAASALAFDPGIDVYGSYKNYAQAFFRELEGEEEFPGGDIDAEVADMIIQIAIFGDVIYG